jgi:hypothetical protein
MATLKMEKEENWKKDRARASMKDENFPNQYEIERT